MRKFVCMLLALLLLQAQLWAQSKTISGKVTDDSGAPIANVSVQVKGSNVGTVTKEDGTYSLSVSNTAKTLIFSGVGLETVEVPIGSKSIINPTLRQSEKSLEEVVVVGYQTVRKRDVASAVSKIGAAEIDNLPMPNFAQAMQGRAAGVIVAAANGVPGGSLSVIIRGVGSISAGTTPLYVVDGIQLNTGTGSINTQNNPLNFLNPDDIESIEILKDAAAASIYGARAANGVVIVTTKKGKSGKPKFTFNVYQGQSSPLQMVESLNSQQWFQLRTEALTYANPASTAASIRNTVLSNMGLPTTTSQGKVDSLPTYDWQKETFGKGSIFNAELSMQGGSQNINYYVSGSYSKQKAFIAPTDFQRGALLTKVSFKINEKFTLDNSISLSTFWQNAPYSIGNTGFGNPAYASAMILPNNPIYNPDGTYYGLPGSGQNMAGTFNHNVVAVGDYVKYNTRTNQLIGSLALTYKVLPDLTLKTLVGLDYRSTQDQRYQDPRVNDGFGVSGRLSNQVDWNTNFISTTTANYRKTIAADHDINLLGGVEFRRDQNQWFQADGQGFPTYLLQYMSAASTPVAVSGQWTASATFSQFAKVGYSYLGKYIFNYTVRRDGSSRFGLNNKYGIFQSAQVAWNAKDEVFLKNVDEISELKIRYSFGQAGNDQIGNVLYAQLYGATRLYGNSSGIFPSQLGNPDLSWETREEHNIGLDLGLFKNRVLLTADAYKRTNKDLLLARSLYNTTGFSSITQNLGQVENEGLELLLSVKPFDGKFKWTSSFNIAFQRNKVKELYDGLQALPGDASIRVGSPLGSFFVAEWAGVNPATGRGMWYDINGNITYNPTAADRKIVGNIYPSKFGGWNNTLSYKGFSLDVFFQYEYGRIRQDGQYTQMMRMAGATVNTLLYGYNTRWQKPGDVVPTPRPFNGLADFNSVGWGTGTRYLFKTDYIRLKQLTLGYDITSELAKRMKIDGARVYVQGINLWTYTKWPSYDPEFTGDNFGIIPQSKNITVGLQVRL
ncbi:SusC/RagA family TonB-linked outer membrane protein [Lacibacter sediminis]|uniref:TonB-dependent receptor n=1 Tax=Lacibacter sediminis TaxID=2760713 RepID=A0A7G5XBR2_9BACT|nr:TonB-dependent receptor [Lacibacter sediminis]QNA42915.1 TonB-dependent receptor [Lacibacter sediminis]